jgi:hypothetical protein
MNKKTVTRSLWAAVAALFVVAGVQATSMRPINLAETIETAEKGFHGEILSADVVQLSGGQWATQVRAQVLTPVMGGEIAGEVVTWYQARHSQEVAIVGMPSYAPGEEYVIFLYPRAEGSEFQSPVGLGQGSFRVHRNRETGEAFVRNEFMNRHLVMNLDTQAIAKAQVERELAQQRQVLEGTQLERRVVSERTSITRTTSGATDLQTFLRTVETLRSVENPSQHFFRDSREMGAEFEVMIHAE